MMSEKRDEREREGGREREGEGVRGRKGEGEREGGGVKGCTFCIHISIDFILHCRPSAQTENKTTQY